MSGQEYLVDIVKGIRKSGFSSITYWSIVISNKSIYFCKLASNELPGIYGAIQDSFALHKAKKSGQNLDDVLNSSQKYYQISRNILDNQLAITKILLGGIVSFDVENSKKLSLKLTNKQYSQLLGAINGGSNE